MKKQLLSSITLLCLLLNTTKAQWVTIPDSILVIKLNNLYPNCMNGNLMDTTCLDILTADTLVINGAMTLYADVLDITGVEYFDNLLYLQFANSDGPTVNITRLPPNLKYLELFDQNFTTLPMLPQSLEYLNANYNPINTLPNLPTNLRELHCNDCGLVVLPNLPDSLRTLFVQTNQLTNLPVLPNYLKEIFCDVNLLTSLPTIPNSLISLVCSHNQITTLPVLPSNVYDLVVNNNLLTTLPPVPSVMTRFLINDNNITCVNNLPQPNPNSPPYYFNMDNNQLQCVPNMANYVPSWINTCFPDDSINNPFNCLSSVNISGKVYSDMNNNCYQNSNDLNVSHIQVQIFDWLNNLVMQNYTQNGNFGFPITQPGNYKVKLNTNSTAIALTCGQPDSAMINLYSPSSIISNIYFPVTCNQAYDLTPQSVSTQGWVFPGQIHELFTDISNNEIWNNLICDTTNCSGTVSVAVNGPISYFSTSNNALVPQISGNIYTYTISNFNNLTPSSLGLRFMTDTTAQANDQICVHVEINPTPLDADTVNNFYDFCYNVVNSYDPNMKEVYPVNVLPGYDGWFTYTIHFQNTGNAPAFNIRLRDTLDTNLDINSFEVRGYSHPAQISMNGNILTVRFNNILLPDSTTDYEGSIGYFQYRLKPLANLPNGTQIENTAYIYFDYNAPIITNTTQNNYNITVKSSDVKTKDAQYVLYPNPSDGLFMFKESKWIQTIEVFNIMGELILSQGNAKIINLQGFPKGIYVARINGSQVCRLIKE